MSNISRIIQLNKGGGRLVVAPGVPLSEVMALRKHIDEAKDDPDYTVVVNYDVKWEEETSESNSQGA